MPSSLHMERISAQVKLPGRHLVDLKPFQMHSRSQAYSPKVFENVVLTRLGPISSSFNRSVLLKGTIRTHTCLHLIDLISNGVLPSLPSRSIRCSSRYAFIAHSHMIWSQIYVSKLIFEFSNSVSHMSKNITWDKSTQLGDHLSNTEWFQHQHVARGLYSISVTALPRLPRLPRLRQWLEGLEDRIWTPFEPDRALKAYHFRNRDLNDTIQPG